MNLGEYKIVRNFPDCDWEKMIVNREFFLKSKGEWIEGRDRPLQQKLEQEFFDQFGHQPNKALANERGLIWPEYHQPHRKCVCCPPQAEIKLYNL